MEQVLKSEIDDVGEECGSELKVGGIERSVEYTCNSCDMTFCSVELHVRDYHPNEEIIVEVENDVAENYGFEEVIEHEEEVVYESASGYECQICGAVLKTGRSLKLHMRVHDVNADVGGGSNDELKHLCKICNRGFSNDEHLSLHLIAHDKTQLIDFDRAPKTGSGYPCNFCGKRFKRPFEKVKHERIHTGERPYSCDLCGKRFRVSSCLTVHLRTHDDSRPFVCPHCKKRFKVQSAYNHHLKIHSNERNYHCSYCSKTFKTAVQLNGHQKSHTKPFACSECNRPFGSLYSVRKHMLIHQQADNKLSYSCNICGANYARAFALRDHCRQQHGDDGSEQLVERDASDGPEEDDETIIDSGTVVEEPFGLKVESEEIIEESLLF